MHADFMPSAGFVFAWSTVQGPDVALPEPPPDRAITSAQLRALGLMNFEIVSR